jgi:para-aminobenzoate synthetase component 1
MPVYQHSLSFKGDAFGVFALFKDRAHVFFLDSSLSGRSARFSYIGFDPIATVDNLSALKKAVIKYHIPRRSLLFPAGAVGYLGYDDSYFFGIYDTIIAIDHQEQRIIVSSFSKNKVRDILEKLRGGPELLWRRARYLPKGAIKGNPGSSGRLLANLSKEHRNNNEGTGPVSFNSNFTKDQYLKVVRQALEHIRRGDIYQINLSHQVKIDAPSWRKYIEPAGIYQHLRQSFPSQFGAYFDDGNQVILSASPERFLKLEKGIAQVKPMKGTRPRGKTAVQDKKNKETLLKSPKEIAELLMVTDLERNDLGRVCDYASIKVTAMRNIETYASVFQATSTVQGKLRRDCDQFDLLHATFPSGSVTGCPKIEAMKIIKKLERGSRGLYTGALGYMSFSGDMDFNVMIRTMFLKKNQITFHVGGGIVADSKPNDEWQETWHKAKPLIETLKKSFA